MVVAFVLGIIVVFQVDLIIFAVLTVWFVVVGILRIAFRPWVVCLLSVVAGALMAQVTYKWNVVEAELGLDTGFIEGFLCTLYMGSFGGAIYGCLFFLFVEAGFRFVDWADNLMRTRSDE
jgi:hypothetical protein